MVTKLQTDLSSGPPVAEHSVVGFLTLNCKPDHGVFGNRYVPNLLVAAETENPPVGECDHRSPCMVNRKAPGNRCGRQ